MLRRALLLSLAVSVVAVACASPTLPLPPPALPSVSAGSAEGLVHLSSKGGAEPNAIVVVVNRNPAVALDKRVGGAQADREGSWSAEVWATSGDSLDVTQETETGERSPPVSVRVP